jgi:hypothetical protein
MNLLNGFDWRISFDKFLTGKTKSSLIFSFLFCLTIVFLYNIHFYDSFFPWTEGWFSMYALEMNHGKVLYKDIYYLMPPGYPKIVSWFTGIFGYDLRSLRIFGLLVILSFSTCLFLIFSEFTSYLISGIITVLVTIYYQYGNAHITYDFIQLMNLTLLISFILLVWSLKSNDLNNYRKSYILIFFSGFFLSIAPLIKQSNGGVVGLLTFLAVAAFCLTRLKTRRIQFLGLYISGCSLPFIILLVDLTLEQSFTPFVQQVFTDAMSAKGDSNQIFFGWINNTFSSSFGSQAKDIFNSLILTGFFLIFIFPNLVKQGSPIASFWNNARLNNLIVCVLALTLIITLINSLYLLNEVPPSLTGMYSLILNHVTTAAILSPLIFCYFSFRFFEGTQRKTGILLGIYCIFLVFGNGTSAGISEAGAYLGLGVGLLLLVTVPSFLNLNYLLFIPVLILFSYSIIKKKTVPYFWWNVTTSLNNHEPIYNQGVLKSIRLNNQQIAVINSVDSIVTKYSKTNSDILCFPHIPIFYLLNKKEVPTKAVIHWFDFLPDNLAMKEAEALEKKDLRVIIELDFGEDVWKAHEMLFRGGKESGQRQIQSIINQKKIKNEMTTKKIVLSNNTNLLISFY